MAPKDVEMGKKAKRGRERRILHRGKDLPVLSVAPDPKPDPNRLGIYARDVLSPAAIAAPERSGPKGDIIRVVRGEGRVVGRGGRAGAHLG